MSFWEPGNKLKHILDPPLHGQNQSVPRTPPTEESHPFLTFSVSFSLRDGNLAPAIVFSFTCWLVDFFGHLSITMPKIGLLISLIHLAFLSTLVSPTCWPVLAAQSLALTMLLALTVTPCSVPNSTSRRIYSESLSHDVSPVLKGCLWLSGVKSPKSLFLFYKDLQNWLLPSL